MEIKDHLRGNFNHVVDSLNYADLIINEIENQLNGLLININDNNDVQYNVLLDSYNHIVQSLCSLVTIDLLFWNSKLIFLSR